MKSSHQSAAGSTLIAALLGAMLSGAAHADVKLHALFSDDMVLQRDKPIPVWGTARVGERVMVTIGNRQQSTVAAADGSWRVQLGAMPVGQNLTLSVQGDNAIVLKNVAVGDVYICSGQSNMEWPLSNSNNAQQEIAAANYPNIRLFTVPKKIAGTPQKEFAGETRWQVCSPQTAPGFSAVGYFFGRELNTRLGIPIGLIDSSWGGTIAQAWTSRETLLKRADLRDATLATEAALAQPEALYPEQVKTWWQQSDKGTRENWSTPALDDAAWPTMKLPGAWENGPLPNHDGLVWFRTTVEIPADWAGQNLTLVMGTIDESDTTYFNGVQIGASASRNQKRVYKIPAEQVKAGRATIAVRVLDPNGPGGFTGDEKLRLELQRPGTEPQAIALDSEWKYQVAAIAKDLAPFPVNQHRNPNQPTVLYNGMIAPLLPFPVRGAIWYQGESNAGNAIQYRTLFPDLIKDWRTLWNARQDGSEFGFYFVQLANYTARVTDPVQSGWPELREAQIMALQLPRTGMATILDIGEANDIHPRNKQDVGKRLALAALAKEYGHKIEYSGPMFKAIKMEGNKARIEFSHAPGLKALEYPIIVMDKKEGEEYPDVPKDFWAYAAINKLREVGIIGEGPVNQRDDLMTRYEFAVAIARLLQNMPLKISGQNNQEIANLKNTIFLLKNEFAPELAQLGIRGGLDIQKPVIDRNQVKAFAIRGEDGIWHHANARIDGESVIVWSDEVMKPIAVRYAWTNNPDVNLVNAAGLPAVPFRTDKP